MSHAAMNKGAASRRSGTRLIAPAASALALVLLAGCSIAKRDSIVVGAVPDDYRTNHPIVIAEKDKVLDLPVAAGDGGVSGNSRAALAGFLADYDRGAAPVLRIMAPHGSMNQDAAARAAHDFAQVARSYGVRSDRIVVTGYQASAAESSAPVRIVFTAMEAQTGKCGRWPEDIMANPENKHYANFGCSYQNNLAAQIANPADLLAPRRQGDVDAENRSRVLDVYRDRAITPEFIDTSEIVYDFQ